MPTADFRSRLARRDITTRWSPSPRRSERRWPSSFRMGILHRRLRLAPARPRPDAADATGRRAERLLAWSDRRGDRGRFSQGRRPLLDSRFRRPWHGSPRADPDDLQRTDGARAASRLPGPDPPDPLNILETAEVPTNPAERVHLQVEAHKRALLERLSQVGDPRVSPADLGPLLSKARRVTRRANRSAPGGAVTARASQPARHDLPLRGRRGAQCRLQNQLAPGKRPIHTLNS